MIFLGDIAHPYPSAPTWSEGCCPWEPQPAIANFEGSIAERPHDYCSAKVLWNDPSIVSALQGFDVRAVCLANNHITDLPGGIEMTVAELQAHNIATFGGGVSPAEAARPAYVSHGSGRVALLGFGWETIQCKRVTSRRPGVNPLTPQSVLESIRSCRKRDADASIVAVFHWNYEMELYPQPAHRQLAMAAIDNGAAAVIGHHPHCVGGVELYKGRPIAYSLGNWWLPQGVYFDGTLRYPMEVRLQLALEWWPGVEPVLHWFRYSPDDQSVHYQASENWSSSTAIEKLTPFQGQTHAEYIDWFRLHRRKRLALPIYRDYRHKARNFAKGIFVAGRQFGVVLADTLQLRRKVAE